MAQKRQALRPDSRGMYARNIGWVYSPDGERTPGGRRYIQPKFYLGRDKRQAELANLRLEQLWDQIVARFQRDDARGSAEDECAAWDDLTLPMAKAIARGEMTVSVACPSKISDDVMYVRWLNKLRADFPVIGLIPENAQAFSQGIKLETRDAVRHATLARRIAKENKLPPSSISNETLHKALDSYSRHISQAYYSPTGEGDERRLTAWGHTQLKNVSRLKERHPDVPLAGVNLKAVEAMVALWQGRPLVKGRKKPISVKTAQTHIKQLRAFFAWLHRDDDYSWRKPEGFEDIKIRVPLTSQEKAARLASTQVPTFDLDELCMLYKYATPLERLLLLLGMNCGFGAAESGTVLLSQVHLFQSHPYAKTLGFESSKNDSFIKRIRLKTGVYGEHLLWGHTVIGVEWSIQRNQGVSTAGEHTRMKNRDTHLILSDRGQSLFTPTKSENRNSRIPNLWLSLISRILKDHPNFRRLSFGKLRKTSGNLIKRFSDGEIAGVFHCRGNPVKTDELSDVYTNRPFAKVFAAIRQVEKYLAPMFDACPDPFPQVETRSGPNISRGKIERIKLLGAENIPAAQIAEIVGVSRPTVYRHLGTSSGR